MRFDRRALVGHLVGHLARLLARELQSRIAPMGLSTGSFPVLLELWEEDGQTQRELVAALGVEQATMANTLGRMERDGLVSRSKDPKDGRMRRVRLTDRARGLEAEAKAAATAVNEAVLADLSGWEREALMQLLAKTIDSARGGGDA